MTITITLPTSALEHRVNTVKAHTKTRVEHYRYERMIRKSQKKIGPFIP